MRNKNYIKFINILKKIFIYILLLIIAFVFIVPIYAVITLSFKTMGELSKNYWGLPQKPNFDAYRIVLFDKYWGLLPYFKNSFIYAVTGTVLSILLASLIAFPISRFKLKGTKFIYLTSILGIVIPFFVMIIPIFKLLDFLRLYNTYPGLIWVYVAINIPFATFVLRNFMISIPNEIQEAAIIDGCSILGLYSRIIMPLAVPSIAVLVILIFTSVYNEFFFAMILSSKEMFPVPVAMGFFISQFGYDAKWPQIAAMALLASIPTMVVFIAAQKYFIKGLTVGAIKG